MGKSALPPGFRFNPTDVELVQYYLKRKILGKQIHVKVVADVDITKWAPWDLPDKSCWQNGDLKWYFFSPIEKKYASGGRLKRATDCGYWKTTGKDRAVLYNSEGVGWIKTLIFHTGRAPQGERTNWVLHEYRLDDKKLADKGIVQDSYVLCILFQKDGIGPRCNKQYGAPFNEEDWTDDEVETDAVSHVNMSETNLVHTAMLEPEPNLTHSYTGEPEIVQANTQGQLLVSTNNTQPHHGYGNVSDPYLVYQNMPQSDSHHASSDPFPSQPSSEPFLSQPSSEPFLSQPSSEPFPSQPSSEPFHSQLSSEPFLSHPSLEPFLCQPSSEPYLSHPGNYNSSITRTISHEPCISDILPSSNVLQPVSSNNVATDLVSPDDEISAMFDYFTEETPFSMDHDICEEVGTLVYSRDANLTADTGGCDYTAKGLGESSKTGYNIPNGAISGAPTENEPYLEVFDLDKPLNGDNFLFPMINPLRPFGEEHYEDDSFFPWRDDL